MKARTVLDFDLWRSRRAVVQHESTSPLLYPAPVRDAMLDLPAQPIAERGMLAGKTLVPGKSLLGPQRHQRIDPGGPPGGDQVRDEGDGGEEERHAGEGEGIARRDAVEEAAQQTGGGQGEREA